MSSKKKTLHQLLDNIYLLSNKLDKISNLVYEICIPSTGTNISRRTILMNPHS